MDVNNINSNINNIQNNISQNQALDKSDSINSNVNKEDDALLVEISKLLQNKRSDFSVTLEESNDALAVTGIMQNSLDKQSSILKDIKDTITDTKEYKELSQDQITTIKDEIREDFSKFEQNSKDVKFKYENLYQAKYEDKELTLTANNNTFTIEKPNLQNIKNDLYSSFSSVDNLEDTSSFENTLDSSINQLETIKEKFNEVETEIKNIAKESISEQYKNYNENSKLREKDFGKEASDFSKTNVNANSGYLAASQANVIQAQTLRLITS